MRPSKSAVQKEVWNLEIERVPSVGLWNIIECMRKSRGYNREFWTFFFFA